MEKDGNNILNLNPTIIDSVERALSRNSVIANVANTASNTNATASLLNDIKEQNTQIISLLQQLVDK